MKRLCSVLFSWERRLRSHALRRETKGLTCALRLPHRRVTIFGDLETGGAGWSNRLELSGPAVCHNVAALAMMAQMRRSVRSCGLTAALGWSESDVLRDALAARVRVQMGSHRSPREPQQHRICA